MAILAATLVIVGVQIFFTSFLLSIIGLRRRERRYDGGQVDAERIDRQYAVVLAGEEPSQPDTERCAGQEHVSRVAAPRDQSVELRIAAFASTGLARDREHSPAGDVVALP